MNKVRLKWTSVMLTLFTFLLPAGFCQNGDFIAGSFILTQKALSEAPYRYSRFLTSALERMEQVDPPSKRDEEKCNVRYRIEPSGEFNHHLPISHQEKSQFRAPFVSRYQDQAISVCQPIIVNCLSR